MSFANTAEKKFKEWLEYKQYSYIYLDQGFDTFSSLFKNTVKRPDFFVLIDGIGLIAVDIKSRKKANEYYHDGYFNLNETGDTQKLLAFERRFKISVWIVFSVEAVNYLNWYWISLSEILEQTTVIEAKDKSPFRSIPLKAFKTIGWDDGLFKLFGA